MRIEPRRVLILGSLAAISIQYGLMVRYQLTGSEEPSMFEPPLITVSSTTFKAAKSTAVERKGDSGVVDDICATSTPVFKNSDAWLQGPRLGNTDNMTGSLARNLILDLRGNNSPSSSYMSSSETIVEQTMCIRKSRFLTWETLSELSENHTGTEGSYQATPVHTLAFRLMFLALHENQHGPARNELKSRLCHATQQHPLATTTQNPPIGPFDFECDPSTKYLLVPVPHHNGFGYIMKDFMSSQLLMGFFMQRVVLFVNAAPGGPEYLRYVWKLSSCPRKDFQCVFMPLTPCVLTKTQLDEATEPPKEAFRELLMTGNFDDRYANQTVLVMQFDEIGPYPDPKGIHEAFWAFISKNIWNQVGLPNDPALMERVKSYILSLGKSTKDLRKSGQDHLRYMLESVSKFYILRPNEWARSKINSIVEDIIPSDFVAETAIGLPIRASDKCKKESGCLSFDQYMRLGQELVEKRKRQKASDPFSQKYEYDKIVVTSETKELIMSRLRYMPKNSSFPFDFLVNEQDAGQGTGDPKTRIWLTTGADNIMISSLISLQLQLYPESLAYNSCSNWHKVIASLFRNGCGLARDFYLESLQNNDNKEFRVRCNWR